MIAAGGSAGDAVIHLAAPYDREDLETDFKDQIGTGEEVIWDARSWRCASRRCSGCPPPP